MHRKRNLAMLLSGVVLAAATTLALFAGSPPPRKEPPPDEGLIDKGALSEMMSAPYTPSLEMRENVHFLVTPALVVQEAIDPDVTPTTPDE